MCGRRPSVDIELSCRGGLTSLKNKVGRKSGLVLARAWRFCMGDNAGEEAGQGELCAYPVTFLIQEHAQVTEAKKQSGGSEGS